MSDAETKAAAALGAGEGGFGGPGGGQGGAGSRSPPPSGEAAWSEPWGRRGELLAPALQQGFESREPSKTLPRKLFRSPVLFWEVRPGFHVSPSECYYTHGMKKKGET